MNSVRIPGNGGNQEQICWSARFRKAALSLAFLAVFAAPDASVAETKRQKVIDFEDELVEGVNRRPLDSLSHLSDAEKKRRKPHLYRKRRGFRAETDETLKVLRYVP